MCVCVCVSHLHFCERGGGSSCAVGWVPRSSPPAHVWGHSGSGFAERKSKGNMCITYGSTHILPLYIPYVYVCTPFPSHVYQLPQMTGGALTTSSCVAEIR